MKHIRFTILFLAVISFLLYPYQAKAACTFSVDTSGNLETGLLGYYALEEATAATRTDSADTNDLSDTNSVAQVSAKVAFGADFVKASSQKLVASSNTIYDGLADFSYAFWVLTPNGNTDNSMVMNKYDSSTGTGPYMNINGDAANKMAFNVSTSGTDYIVKRTTTSVNDGSWHFIVGTRTGATVKIYHNAVDETTAVSSGGTLAATVDVATTFKLGGALVTAHDSTATIDEAGVWNKVLTDQEITDLYNSGNGQTCGAGGGVSRKIVVFENSDSGGAGSSVGNSTPTPTPTPMVATVEVLGGGGGGGIVNGSSGGGGGGGEYRRCTETLTVQSYTVTIGTGGLTDNTGETDSSFVGTGISVTADGGNGTTSAAAGSAGTGGASTDCDTADANFDGGTPGAGDNDDFGGGGGGGAGYGGTGGNGASAGSTGPGGAGGGGGGETGEGGDAVTTTVGAAGSGGGGVGGEEGAGDANGSKGGDGVPATYHIVGGGGGGGSGGPTARVGGACSLPGGGGGGSEATGQAGCRGEVRIIYIDADVNATGGTETTSGIYRIHTFTTTGTFTVS